NTIDTNSVYIPTGGTPARQTQQQGLHTNYVVCAGSTSYGASGTALNGAFYVKSKVRIESITDGTSNTLFASEIRLVPDSSRNDLRGRYCNSWEGNNWFSTLNPPNTTLPDRQNYQGVSIVGAPMTNVGTGDASKVLSARSAHTTGVNSLLGDGS